MVLDDMVKTKKNTSKFFCHDFFFRRIFFFNFFSEFSCKCAPFDVSFEEIDLLLQALRPKTKCLYFGGTKTAQVHNSRKHYPKKTKFVAIIFPWWSLWMLRKWKKSVKWLACTDSVGLILVMSHMSHDVIADFLEFFNYGGRHPSIR